MKVFVGTFNQEKALAGASSVIVKTDGSFAALLKLTLITYVTFCNIFPPCQCFLSSNDQEHHSTRELCELACQQPGRNGTCKRLVSISSQSNIFPLDNTE